MLANQALSCLLAPVGAASFAISFLKRDSKDTADDGTLPIKMPFLSAPKKDYCNFRMTRAGLPTASECAGIFLVTTEPAPIVQPSPMVTPGQITVLPPIQQSSPMVTGLDTSKVRRSTIFKGCEAV